MKFAEFKAMLGFTALNFYKSKTTSRFVASFKDTLIVTTETFNPKLDAYAYPNPVSTDGGWILSNTAPAEAVFSL